MTRDIRLGWSSPRTPDTHTYCRSFSSGAVTTCFYDLDLSRLGFRMRGQCSNPLRHRRGQSDDNLNLLNKGHALFQWDIITKQQK